MVWYLLSHDFIMCPPPTDSSVQASFYFSVGLFILNVSFQPSLGSHKKSNSSSAISLAFPKFLSLNQGVSGRSWGGSVGEDVARAGVPHQFWLVEGPQELCSCTPLMGESKSSSLLLGWAGPSQ